jgi:RNA polymerase sigma-B factor
LLQPPGKTMSGRHPDRVLNGVVVSTLSQQTVPLPYRPSSSDSDGHACARRLRNERTQALLERAAGARPERRQALLEQVVLLNQEVAHAVAGRYRSRGVSDDDLCQVACLALVKAAQRFDPFAGHDFLSFAVPTMRGEVQHYFRDHGWMVRPSRRIQELQSRINAAEDELTFALGRSPRPSDIARHLGEDVRDVEEALAPEGCFTPTSLDRPIDLEHGSGSLSELVAHQDASTDAAEARVMLAPAVRRLCDRDRRILMLRFFRGWTQEEIGQELGVTQMQVSRLLSSILSDLRGQLGVGPGPEPCDRNDGDRAPRLSVVPSGTSLVKRPGEGS